MSPPATRQANEGFQVQDPVHVVDALAERNQSRRSGVITSRKGLLIFGIGLIGVLAITAVAVTVSTIPTSSTQQAVDYKVEAKESVRSPAIFGEPLRHKLKEKLKADNEKPEEKLNVQLNRKKSDSKICKTPQCLSSAEKLQRAIDTSVDPCDDFYEFACGGWYKSHPITNESDGTFFKADDSIQKHLHEILESDPLPGDPKPVQDIRVHYDACMDTDSMDALGLTPLWAQLNVQGGWPIAMDSWQSDSFILEEALSRVMKLSVNPLISMAISSDIRNTSHKIIYVLEGELGTSSTYLLEPENHETELRYYKKYIADSAKLARDSIGSKVTDESIEKDTEDLVKFEISIAKSMNFLPRNISDIFTKTNIAAIQTVTDSVTSGEFDWLTFFRVKFAETDVVINENEKLYAVQQKYFSALSTLLSKTPERTVANYLGWWWTKTTGPETTYAMRNVSFAYDHSMNGKDALPDRSDYCVDQTNLRLGFPLSRAYVDAYFPMLVKEETTELVALIRKAFQSLLSENTWMAPDDLTVAKEKLKAIEDFEAFPDWIMDNALITLAYDGLEIRPKQQFNNLMRMAEYYDFWNLETFRDSYTKTFIMPPTVVNAFYDPFSNSITILAGILQSPFYVHNSLAALNYGGIGMVIGHEFTHGFDNTGRRFDKDGNLVSWWSKETVDAFNERTKCFKKQYSTYSPPELQNTQYSNMTVNGKQTLGENIADNGGIREAFKAYMSYVEKYGEEPRLFGLEQYSPDQMFFIGFANVWCEHKTTDDIVRQLETDPHSPGRFRVIGPLSNDVDFRNTFNCPLNSPMNRGEQSCLLW